MNVGRLRRFLADRGPGRVGRYHLLSEVGRGGTATVWTAWDPELDRVVAIKLLRYGPVDRLRQEATAAARLRHPHIVTVHEVGPDYFVMEYVEGVTLAEGAKSLALDDRLRLLEAVARAVHHAHEQGIIHRDLKPSNILIDATGIPVVTDFGLAKVDGRENLTLTGTVVGTPRYMAPEQIRGRDQGRTVDVWALGVVLHELVSGKSPFGGATPAEIYDRVVRRDPPSLPGQIGAIVRKALQKDQSRRYRTAAELADDLARFRQGQRVRAPRAWPRLRRLGAAASLAGLVVLAAVALRWQWRRSIERAHLEAASQMAQATPSQHEDEGKLTALLAREPRNVALLLRRARVRSELGNDARDRGFNPLAYYAAAEQDATAALAVEPSTGYVARGWIRLQRAGYQLDYGLDPLPDCAAAEEDLRKADPTPTARGILGAILFKRGLAHEAAGKDASADFAEAERVLAPATDVVGLQRRGRLMAHLRRFDEADRDFGEALRQQPEQPWVWLWRAEARVTAGDRVAAERYFAQAVSLMPTLSVAWEQRGLLRLAHGDRAGAARDLAEAIRLNPARTPLLGPALARARSAP